MHTEKKKKSNSNRISKHSQGHQTGGEEEL